MILRSRNQTLVWFAMLLLCFLWYHRLQVRAPYYLGLGNGFMSGGSEKQDPERMAFIQEAMEVEFGEPMAVSAIQGLCNSKTWQEGLLVSCDHVHGGIGNVRNHILNCVRYAIEAGAALVIPTITERNAANISDIYTTDSEGMEYLLNRTAFVDRLSNACPGLALHDKPKDFLNYGNLQETLSLTANTLEPGKLARTGLREPKKWRTKFDAWLHNATSPTAASPVHVKLGRAYLEFPVHSDGASFVANFGKMLSFRNDVLYLAAAALWELSQRFSLPVAADELISPDAFYGAHLRVEDDAVQAWPGKDWKFQRYEVQASEQIAELGGTGLSVLYIATGNLSLARQFGEEAAAAIPSRNITPVTKHDLLVGKDLKLLQSLTFDQQGLVDFMVLLKASRFAGIGHSSFAWNIALRRHELSAEEGIDTRGGKVGFQQKLLEDEFSAILGYQETKTWMAEYRNCMWP